MSGMASKQIRFPEHLFFELFPVLFNFNHWRALLFNDFDQVLLILILPCLKLPQNGFVFSLVNHSESFARLIKVCKMPNAIFPSLSLAYFHEPACRDRFEQMLQARICGKHQSNVRFPHHSQWEMRSVPVLRGARHIRRKAAESLL
jgi:hypothetical protein